MFHEDDRRLKEQKRAKRKGRIAGKYRILITAVFVLACLAGLSLAVLSALGGSHTALKKGMEDYLSTATGLDATVGRFGGMEFFPDLKLDAGDIVLRERAGKNQDEKSGGAEKARIGSIRLSTTFWSLVFSISRFETLEMSDLRAEAGVFTDGAVSVGFLGLRPGKGEDGTGEDGGAPGLAAEGTYDGRPLKFFMLMEGRESAPGKILYRAPKDGRATLSVGSLAVEAQTSRTMTGTKTKISRLSAPDERDLAVLSALCGQFVRGRPHIPVGSYEGLPLPADHPCRKVLIPPPEKP